MKGVRTLLQHQSSRHRIHQLGFYTTMFLSPRPHRTSTTKALWHLSWETSPPHHRLPTLHPLPQTTRNCLHTSSPQYLNFGPVYPKWDRDLHIPRRSAHLPQANKPKPPPTISPCTLAVRRVGFTGCSPTHSRFPIAEAESRAGTGDWTTGLDGSRRARSHTPRDIDTVHNTRAAAPAVGAVNSHCRVRARLGQKLRPPQKSSYHSHRSSGEEYREKWKADGRARL